MKRHIALIATALLTLTACTSTTTGEGACKTLLPLIDKYANSTLPVDENLAKNVAPLAEKAGTLSEIPDDQNLAVWTQYAHTDGTKLVGSITKANPLGDRTHFDAFQNDLYKIIEICAARHTTD
ncbi:hypothetical protein INS90_10170 [Trueperella pecoris]|uniref:Lipoprotein n=1 Tax=Trueperella pecoris TaxID=2733571 RepID=A0A7M1R296_9ACTO|nr:hypothetical protein [Trueperella pecoris]QOR47595.1 hypothetical protein INS90_10170 [Trueperella pecoris]